MRARSARRATEHLAVAAFRNFLAWGVRPGDSPRPVPPAWYAYARGISTWCPPPGEL